MFYDVNKYVLPDDKYVLIASSNGSNIQDAAC